MENVVDLEEWRAQHQRKETANDRKGPAQILFFDGVQYENLNRSDLTQHEKRSSA